MRVSLMYAVLSLVAAGVFATHTSFGQEPENRMTTIEMENETLEALFTKLRAQTGLSFAFPPRKVNEYKNINLPRANRTVKEVLNIVLKGTGLTYKFKGNKVFIFEDKKEEETVEVDAVNASGNSLSIPVTGRVTDASTQQALAGVNIIVKGTTQGTSSDPEGRFSINVEENDVLVFSFIGFKSFEVQVVGGKSTINVAMEVDASELQEVVVNAGYYDVKKTVATGNISKVTAKEIERQPVTNPLAALQGRMPGVYVQQASGTPGGDFRIQIRGRNSLRDDGNEPLYIVDGVPFSTEKTFSIHPNGENTFAGPDSPPNVSRISPLASLNTADIESIEILKDADATAIYGSRGANGVVLISTKKGKVGKTKFDLNIYSGVGKVRRLDWLSTQQYLNLRRQAFANEGLIPSSNPADDGSSENGYRLYAPDLMVWDTTRYTDWEELFFKSAQTTSVQSSVSGGNEHIQFIFSLGYRKENSIYPEDLGYQKGSFHLATYHQSTDKKFTLNASFSGTKDRNDQPVLGLIGSRNLPPNAPKIYDEYGNLNWENSTWQNPFAGMEIEYYNNAVNFVSNIVIGYELLKGLQLKTSLGLTYLNSDERNKKPKTYYDPILGYSSEQSEVRDATGTNQSWSIEPQLSWERKIGGSKLNVLAGCTFQEQRLKRKADYYRGFPSDALMDNLASASINYNLEYVQTLYRYAALFGRINYNWKDKYILNLTARRDGSSRFGPRRQFSNFGAFGAAWIFSNESFVRNNVSFISFGKLRTSYGITGSDQIGNYQYLDTYAPGVVGSNQYQGVSILSPTKLFNANYAWEVSNKFEAALELGFWNDRISLSTSFFRNRSSSQLVEYALPQTTGFSGILANLPATVQNMGVELELAINNLPARVIHWTTSLNLTIPRNKLLAFPNLESSSYANRYVVGKPLSVSRYYESTGVNPETGLWTFRDFNEDGLVTDLEDRKKIMFQGQEFFGGLNNSIAYKGWTLDFLFQFVKQTGVGAAVGYGMPGSINNVPEFLIHSDIWRKPGDHSKLQRLYTNNTVADKAFANYRESDAGIIDASFIRLKNISISYQLPEKWVKKFTCRLYFQGQNLSLITGYEGDDPENQQFTTLPPLRVFTGGFQLTL